MFLSVMVAIGLFVFRMLIARPLVRRVEGTSLRALTIAFGVAAALGLIAVPVYLDVATAVDSLRSFFDRRRARAALPRDGVRARATSTSSSAWRSSAPPRAIALWVDRPAARARARSPSCSRSAARSPPRPRRCSSRAVGHAGQTAPRGLSLLLDWLHLVSGSIWLGGLVGLLDPVGEPAGAGGARRPLGLRAAVLEHRVRLGAGPARHAGSARPCCTSRCSPRCGRPPTAWRSWSRSGCSRRRCCSAAVNLLRTKPASSPPGSMRAGRGGRPAAAPDRPRRDGARRRPRSRRRHPLEPAAAAAGARAARRGARDGRPGPRRLGGAPGRIHAPGARQPERAGGAQLVRAPGHAGAASRSPARTSRSPSRCSTCRWGTRSTSSPRHGRASTPHSAPALVMAGRWGCSFRLRRSRATPFTALLVDHAGG